MQPANNPESGQWFWLDARGVAEAKGLENVYPLELVAQGKPLNTVWPKPRVAEQPYTNNHLTYAFTWFALAGALVAVYFLSQSSRD
ncbi:MAG TPA: SURF1 family cytochrome oxidase biogenesis protein, partial [Alphaproteobacteria bacterium]|nr:SURF1 family cytochrome oxidase biogenesis protein [Alphaproteobacteria bacterium]